MKNKNKRKKNKRIEKKKIFIAFICITVLLLGFRVLFLSYNSTVSVRYHLSALITEFLFLIKMSVFFLGVSLFRLELPNSFLFSDVHSASTVATFVGRSQRNQNKSGLAIGSEHCLAV